MKTLEIINEQYRKLQSANGSSLLTPIEKNAFDAFSRMGIPTVRNEEWKYTRISSLFQKDLVFSPGTKAAEIGQADLEAIRLPGHENANELVLVNGSFAPELSNIRSADLVVQGLEEASKNEFKEIVFSQLTHSSKYLNDGINALNTAFVQEGIFVYVKKGLVLDRPVYIYHLNDARRSSTFVQPRMLVYVGIHAHVQMVETYFTLGNEDSLSNQVLEIAVEQDAIVEYYKIQNDRPGSNQVSTTHFRQLGKSQVHAVTITLQGGIIRNNLNMVMEAEYCESNLYGLYFIGGTTHVDNHTVVDNVKPHCLSNELYKGIIDDKATAVFNGKIFVQPDAQKINAFQSNKNILLSDTASVNTKPQLEIFADDVKCSHGCTVGQLDEEAMFYLRSRGLPEKSARALLIHGFVVDVLDYIKPMQIREYVDALVSQSLEVELE